MPTTPLRVLFVEDSENDATLELRALKRGGFAVESLRVDTAPDFVAAIEEQTWDVILSDFSMPDFNGFAAFELLMQNGLDIPFIFVSGRIGEDKAAEAMRRGAKDYILKDNLNRLVPAVERELKEAEGRRKRQAMADALRASDEKLRRNERLLQTVFDTLPVHLVVKDAETRYLMVNRAWCERYGLTPEQVIGKTSLEPPGRPEEDRRNTLAQDRKTLAYDGKTLVFEGWDTTAGGELRHFQSFRAPLRDESGRVTGLVGATVDLTELKRAEEALQQNNVELESANEELQALQLSLEAEIAERTLAEQRFRQLVDLAPNAIVTINGEGRILLVNSQTLAWFGYGREELLGQPIEMLVPERYRTGHPAHVRGFFQTPSLRRIGTGRELYGLRKDGSEFPVDISLSPIDTAEGPQVIASVVDLTALNRAAKELEAKEFFLRRAQEAGGMGVWSCDLQTRETTWSEQTYRIYGLDPADGLISHEKFLASIHPDDREQSCRVRERALAEGGGFTDQFRIVRPDGSTRYLEEKGEIIKDRTGAPLQMAGITQDITARIQAAKELEAKEYFLRRAQEAGGVGVWERKLDSEEYVWSDETYRIFGLDRDRDTLTLERLLAAVHPDDRAAFISARQQSEASHSGFNRRHRVVWPNGEIRTVESRAAVVREPSGAMLMRGTVQDVTQREMAEAELKRAEERLRAIIENSLDVIVVLDGDARFSLVSPSVVARLGYAPEELHGQSVLAFIYPEDLPLVQQELAAVMGTQGAAGKAEFRLRHKDGSWRYFEVVGKNLLDNPVIEGVLGTFRDITERKGLEEALRAKERLLQTVFDTIPHMLIVKDSQSRYLMVNRAWSENYGISSDEVVQKHSLDLTGRPRPEMQKITEDDQRVLAGSGAMVIGETILTDKEGKKRYLKSIKAPLRDDHGQIAGLVALLVDQTTEKEAQRDAALSHARLVDAIESLPAAFFLYDADERLVLWNSRVRDFFPRLYDRFRPGMRFEDVLRSATDVTTAAADRPEEWVRERLTQFRTSPGRFEQLLADGRWMHGLDHRTSDGGTVCLRFDVTETKRQEEMLRQSQKLEAIGSLAGGISHDFNNLLTVISSHAEFIVEAAGGPGQIRDDAQMILDAGARAAALTRQLLAFSRKQVLQMRVLDLNAIVANLEKMLQRLIGEDIELRSTLAPTVKKIHADPTQIEQIVMNLVVNARDAMPKGGKLVIETANKALDATYTSTHTEMIPGDYVMLAVTDTGEGMDEATQARVFEPFFTTKPQGKGTGMGLATVYGIVKQMNGSIFVYSEPGKGTTFKIYFPAPAAGPTAAVAQDTPEQRAKPTETVLLVEDEELVRRSAARILEGEGYTVLQAASAEEALEIVAARGATINLLLSDVVMPGMSGGELWERIRGKLPIRVLFMSGYTDDAIVRHGVLEGGVPFINKPFSRHSLLNKVREVLNQTDSNETPAN